MCVTPNPSGEWLDSNLLTAFAQSLGNYDTTESLGDHKVTPAR